MDNNDQIFHSVTDLRQRILVTEQTMHNLDALSELLPHRPRHGHGQPLVSEQLGVSPDSLRMQSLNLDDLSEERDSHQSLERPFMVLQEKVHSPKLSSPKSSHTSQHLQRTLSNRGLADDFDFNLSFSKSSSMNKFADFESENLSLRQKLQQLREKNARMVSQNHSLLNQLETGCSQLRTAQAKVEQLTEEIRDLQTSEEHLQEKISRMQDEQNFQEQQAESLTEKYRQCEKQRASSEEENILLQKEIQKLQDALNDSNLQRNRSDQDRDRAIQAAEKIRAAYERFHKKSDSKFLEREKVENHLQESLQHLNEERQTLMKTCQLLKEQVSSLREENQDLAEDNLSEKEQRCLAEAANLDLKMTFAKSKHKIAEMEKELGKADALREEMMALRQVSRGHEAVLLDYEAKLQQAQKNDESSDLDESQRNSQQALTEVISQLSQQLVVKEGEIQNLRTCVLSSPAKVENISFEVEDDPVSEVDQKRVSDLEEELSSFLIKLEHRASQVQELQCDMEAQSKELSQAQKELNKAKSQATTMKRQVNEKVYEVTQLMSQSAEMEDQLDTQKRALDASRRELQLEKERVAEAAAARKDMQQLHKRQCSELQIQVDKLQEKWQTSADEQENYQKRLASLENIIQARDEQLTHVTHELRERRNESESVLAELQQRSTDASDQIAELESNLLITKQDLCMQADAALKAKTSWESQLQQMQKRLDEAERQLRVSTAALAESQMQVVALERDLSERQSLLEAANVRLEDLEESLQGTDAQICSLERQLEAERNSACEEKVRHEHMQRSADADIVKKDGLIQSLRNAVEEAEQKAHDQKLNSEDLQEHLEDTKKQLKESLNLNAKSEADLKLTRDQIDEQMMRVESLEEDLNQHTRLNADREEKLATLNSELSAAKFELCQRIPQLEDVSLQLTAVEQLLVKEKENCSKFTQLLRQKEDELRGRATEKRELETELEQRQRDLEQRISQMAQLDMIMKEHNSGTEQRLIRLEAALKKSQVEAMQRTQQVTGLDEQLQGLREQLREKDLQLQQAEQLQQKSCGDLTRSEGDRHQLEEIITEAGRQQELLNAQNLQLKQELILSRNDLQKLTQDFDDHLKERSMNQREIEHLKAEIADLGAQTERKDEEKKMLNKELEVCRLKEKQIKAAAEAESRKLSRQLEVRKEQHAQEVASLQKTQSLIVTSQKEMGTSLQLEIEKLRADDQALREEVILTRAQESQLRDEMTAGQSLLVKANEEIIIKDSESVRLKAKVSSLQRSLCQLSRSDGTASFITPSSYNTTDSQLPQMDISTITASGDKDPLSLQSMLQEVNQTRDVQAPPPGSVDQLLMTSKAPKSKAQSNSKQKNKNTKKSTTSKNHIPKPKVKLGSAHPRNKPSDSCVDNVRDRLAALMGKVTTMTVEGFQLSDQEETDDERKKHSPDLPEKSFDLSSAVEHYGDAEVDPQRLSFSLDSSSISSQKS